METNKLDLNSDKERKDSGSSSRCSNTIPISQSQKWSEMIDEDDKLEEKISNVSMTEKDNIPNGQNFEKIATKEKKFITIRYKDCHLLNKEDKGINKKNIKTGEKYKINKINNNTNSSVEIITIPIKYNNDIHQVSLDFIEPTEGKKQLLRQHIEYQDYELTSLCYHYLQGKCCFGTQCRNVHIHPSHITKRNKKHFKNDEKKHDIHKQENNKKEINEIKECNTKLNKFEYICILFEKNTEDKTNVKKIPIEVIEETKQFLYLQKLYQNKMIKDYCSDLLSEEMCDQLPYPKYCHMHNRGLCKFGKQCNRIHIKKWFIERILKF